MTDMPLAEYFLTSILPNVASLNTAGSLGGCSKPSPEGYVGRRPGKMLNAGYFEL